MTGISLGIFTPTTRSAKLQQLAAACGLAGAAPRTLANGKPYLELGNSRHGLAITHLRKGPQPLSLMAVSHEPAIGIDAEYWPEAQSDQTFLRAIAAPEDAAMIERAGSCSRDTAILLWSIKEAALKALGDVMHEPAELAVRQLSQHEFAVMNSRQSSAPLAETFVQCWQFSAGDKLKDGLVCVAFSPRAGRAIQRQIFQLQAPDLQLQPLFHLTKD